MGSLVTRFGLASADAVRATIFGVGWLTLFGAAGAGVAEALAGGVAGVVGVVGLLSWAIAVKLTTDANRMSCLIIKMKC